MVAQTEANRTFAICVDSYEESVMTGQFYCFGQQEEAETFRSLPQLLTAMEQRLNESKYPQSFTARRSFSPIQEARPDGHIAVKAQRGKLGTFVVKILFRQHASWQGLVTWMEGRGEQAFRSVLELVLLMDSALKPPEGTEQTAPRFEGADPKSKKR